MVVGGIDGVGSGLGYRGVGAFAELGWLVVVLYGSVAGGVGGCSAYLFQLLEGVG